MKLNNKGMTLTELLASVTMLSVAMVMMYGLMSNIQKKKNEVDDKSGAIIPISDIESAFQEIVMEPLDYGDIKPGEPIVWKKIGIGSDNIICMRFYRTNYLTTKCEYKITLSNKAITIEHYTCGRGTGDSSCVRINNDTYKQTLNKECVFDNASVLSETSSDTSKRKFLILIKCGNGNTTDYIKFPMYFK